MLQYSDLGYTVHFNTGNISYTCLGYSYILFPKPEAAES